ncbi:MAG TPA: hypothetical protein VJ437_07070 [Acidiferrobacterales bacterium]|nr:hypothetical protein [Acidiferrobacterales bacterium]
MPSPSDRTVSFVSVAVLAALMLLTRFQHFGSGVNLADASLAVFFLAGLFLSWRWFPVFALLAAGIDYAAIGWAGVSDYCVTPAYAFLLPTYAAMTFAGAWARRYRALRIADLASLAVVAALGAAVAFAISNASFYFFAGYFAGLSFADYLARTAHYVVPYLAWALFYIAAGLAVVTMARRIRAAAAARA